MSRQPGATQIDVYIVLLTLIISPPTVYETNINVTHPWPEFYRRNQGSYKYTLAEPTSVQETNSVLEKTISNDQ